MNTVIENILSRRSVRSFTDKKIPRNELELLVKCAYHAPSARNLQTWNFTVVQNKELLNKAAKAIADELGRADYDFYRPDALILASNDRESPYGKEDCAVALENIFLAAHSLEIASVWINQFNGICDAPKIRTILDALGIPANHLVWGCAALGYPSEAPAPAQKKQNVSRFLL